MNNTPQPMAGWPEVTDYFLPGGVAKGAYPNGNHPEVASYDTPESVFSPGEARHIHGCGSSTCSTAWGSMTFPF
jgi:hypothetical protein